jgi:hypothetical protein
MPPALHAFTALGERLERAWSATGYDERAFPALAHAHLAGSDLDVRPDALLVEFLRATTLPAQHGIDFGRPALVVHDGRHFFIEVLYWTAGSVSIHQHAFSGAFQVLGGSSVHCSFTFDEVHRVNSRFLLGELTRTGSELLETGATRTITAGALIHSLFHLDQPSVTVVVRTRSEAAALPQYTYEAPHVAIDSFYRDPIGRRRLEALALLREIQAPAWRAAILDHVTAGDLQMCYEGLRLVVDDPALFADLFARARASHGERADYLPPVFERMQRRDVLVARRKTITDAGHRFFLALLLNLDTREQILEQVAARVPGPPIATILRWVRELSTRCGADDPVFGLHLSDAESEIFECLLHGRSFPEVLRQLVDSYGADEVASQQVDIAQFHGALRDNQVYKPLFQA